MAKRRRLTPPYADGAALSALQNGGDTPADASHPNSARAPIASVAADISAQSALAELSDVMAKARRDGRMVQELSLNSIDESYLVRDRASIDEAELAHLIASIRTHGQRHPIEVAELGAGKYGLISGWRRLTALRRLSVEDARFGYVLALSHQPGLDSDAYVAMVEENEIRHGLSYYERARIAAKAVEAGAFKSEKLALQHLYAAASRARRSKIGAFLNIYHALDGFLHFPSSMPERLGLSLSKRLGECEKATKKLRNILSKSLPSSPDEERALITGFLNDKAIEAPKRDIAASNKHEISSGVFIEVIERKNSRALTVSGPNISRELCTDLTMWLRDRK